MDTEQEPLKSGFGPQSTAEEMVAGLDLRGKVMVVTGGHSGIGLETTRVLSNAGVSVIVGARDSNELLEEFGLSDVASRSLSKFSGGMRRRLDFAVSLIHQPPLIFLDEPTTGLDPRSRTQMWQTIRKLVKGGSTVLLTTQYLDEADQLADNIVVIDKGQVVANDTPNGLKRSVGSSSLHLTVKDADNAANAAQIIERILDAKVHFAEASELIAPMDNIDKLTDVLMTLKDAGIALSGG